MCISLVTGVLRTSSIYAPRSVCHCIADKWDILSLLHRTRFALEIGRSFTDLMRKLIRSSAICQMSYQVRDFCRSLSRLVHCPCCGCWTAFWTILESSFSRIALMTMPLFSLPSAFDHQFVTDEPSPLRPV